MNLRNKLERFLDKDLDNLKKKIYRLYPAWDGSSRETNLVSKEFRQEFLNTVLKLEKKQTNINSILNALEGISDFSPDLLMSRENIPSPLIEYSRYKILINDEDPEDDEYLFNLFLKNNEKGFKNLILSLVEMEFT